MTNVMLQRVDAGRGDVGIFSQIAAGVERRMRPAAFLPAARHVMHEPRLARRRDVGILREVPGFVEARMRVLPRAKLGVEIMEQRRLARRRTFR